MNEYYDAIIVGTGAAGLYCALNLPKRKKILMLTKQGADLSDSFLALFLPMRFRLLWGKSGDFYGMTV